MLSKKGHQDKYYTVLFEIKGFNAFIDNKPFFEQPIEKQKASKTFVQMSRNNYYTIRNLLDYLYHENQYKTHWYEFIKTDKYNYFSKK